MVTIWFTEGQIPPSLWTHPLTLSWRRPLSYRIQSIDLLCKSMDWFLYDSGLRHERVKKSYWHSKCFEDDESTEITIWFNYLVKENVMEPSTVQIWVNRI